MNYTFLGTILLAILLIAGVFSYILLRDYDCSDFTSQPMAQEVFNKNKKDVYGLDRNHNKVACENI